VVDFPPVFFLNEHIDFFEHQKRLGYLMTQQTIKLIRLPEILHRIPYSEAHIWRLERAGKFPRRAHLGANRVAWVESEIDSWIEDRVNARTEGVE